MGFASRLQGIGHLGAAAADRMRAMGKTEGSQLDTELGSPPGENYTWIMNESLTEKEDGDCVNGFHFDDSSGLTVIS